MPATDVLAQIKALEPEERAKVLDLLLEMEAAQKVERIDDRRFDEAAERVLAASSRNERTPFLTVAQVERLHRLSIERFGGTPGLRDPLLFEGAFIHPRNVYYYGQGDLFDVAAAYAFHIAQAQAFLDGNKRTGIGAALVFLEVNGVSISADTARLYDAMIGIAERRMDKAQLTALLRELEEN